MRVLIIANPIIGINKEKREILNVLSSRISRNGGNVDITYTMKPGLGKVYSSRAALEGYDAVYAAGGDGTINDVASGLVKRPTPLGIIPLGTGNGLARSLGIPLQTDRLIEMLLAHKTTLIDVGKISSRFFVATAGIGYDAMIAHDFNKQHTPFRHLYKYFWVGIKNYFVQPSEKLVLFVDGTEMHRKVFALTIANVSQYGGGAVIAPQAGPQSGSLIAVLVPKLNMFKAIPAVLKLFTGSVNTLKDIEFLEFKNLKIKRAKPGFFHVDGEVFEGSATLNVTVIPGALKVIVP
ncbi:YegS/Rv2252/BmrU family lipid kinase [bacterium]|nr:YegS/Rv2252/BmrU family lipid kinase [bacterium]